VKRYPMKLSYVPKEIIWGGDRLKSKYNKSADFEKIAESWELTARHDGMSHVTNGTYAETSLQDLITRFPEFVSQNFNGGCFPLLIKFIDAADDLSVQVHPDDIYAGLHEDSLGKTEMWYIVEADDDASIIYGLANDISRENFIKALHGEFSEALLNKCPVKRGDVFYIPAGQVHAICRGSLIAEIQQNSNVTYRIYDYGRLGFDGKPRELHIERASNTVKAYTSEDIFTLVCEGNKSRRKDLAIGKVLCNSKYFRVTLLSQESKSVFTVDEKSFVAMLFTDAKSTFVSAGSVTVKANKGDCIFIPAGTGLVTVDGSCEALISEI